MKRLLNLQPREYGILIRGAQIVLFATYFTCACLYYAAGHDLDAVCRASRHDTEPPQACLSGGRGLDTVSNWGVLAPEKYVSYAGYLIACPTLALGLYGSFRVMHAHVARVVVKLQVVPICLHESTVYFGHGQGIVSSALLMATGLVSHSVHSDAHNFLARAFFFFVMGFFWVTSNTRYRAGLVPEGTTVQRRRKAFWGVFLTLAAALVAGAFCSEQVANAWIVPLAEYVMILFVLWGTDAFAADLLAQGNEEAAVAASVSVLELGARCGGGRQVFSDV